MQVEVAVKCMQTKFDMSGKYMQVYSTDLTFIVSFNCAIIIWSLRIFKTLCKKTQLFLVKIFTSLPLNSKKKREKGKE